MSKYYRVRVNAPSTAVSDFLVRADSIAQARAGVARELVEVEMATPDEILTAGRNDVAIVDFASETTIDDGQQSLPLPAPIPDPAASTNSFALMVAQNTGD